MFKNKKAIWFPALTSVCLILIGFVVIDLLLISPAEASYVDSEFDILNNVDLKNNLVRNEEMFIESYTKLFLKESKNEFLKDIATGEGFFQFVADVADDVADVFGSGEDEFVGCSFEGKLIFFNEQNKEIDEELTDCSLGFEGDFRNKYFTFIEENLKENIRSGLDPEVSNLDEVSISNDEISTEFTIQIETSFLAKDTDGQVQSKNEYVVQSDLGLYEELIVTLEKTMPLLSGRIQAEILSCKDQNDFQIEEANSKCSEQILKRLVESTSPSLSNKYTYRLEQVPNEDVEGYLGYELAVLNSQTNEVELQFMIVIKDSIPYDVVDFSVSSFEGLDNVIDVKIAELGGSISPTNYIIMYSYQNFLDRTSYGSARYDRLIEMLENSEIPNSFERFGNGQYYSNDELGLDLNLIVVDATQGFDNGKRTVKLFQINNMNTGEYDLLEPGREIYVSVFAVDSSYNYFTDEVLLERASKSIVPSPQIGPDPMTNSFLSHETVLEGYDSSFTFEIDSYTDTKANSFILYVTKGRNGEEIVDGCNGVSYECEFKVIPYSLGETKSYFVSSDSVDTYTAHETIRLNQITLDYGEEYEFMIGVYDSSNKAILKGTSRDLFLKEREGPNRNNELIRYYEISKVDGVTRIAPAEIKVTIEDKKDPVASDIIIKSIQINSDSIFFDWSPSEGSDVEKILVSGKGFTSSGSSSFARNLDPEDFVIPVTETYDRIEINSLTMLDAAGNSGLYGSVITNP